MKTRLLILATALATGIVGGAQANSASAAATSANGATAAKAACPAFPVSHLLGNLSHERVIGYVDRTHNGDWSPYIRALRANVQQLQGIARQGRGAVLKRGGRDVQLTGDELTRYIAQSREWLDVSRCLAEQTEIARLANFATAAGAAEAAQQATSKTNPSIRNIATKTALPGRAGNSQIANVEDGKMRLEVTSYCDGDATVFKVVNLGDTWLKQGNINVYSLSAGEPRQVTARRMRMKEKQKATFKVAAKRNPTGTLGLWIEPTWYERPLKFDAQMTCG